MNRAKLYFILILTIILVMLISTLGHAESNENKIARKIYKLTNKQQVELARKIVEIANKYDIDPQLISAIAAKESMYGKYIHNKTSKDYGIMQVNIYNINAYGWDKDRMLSDQEYALEKGVFILYKIKKTYKKREPDTWVCRYNIGYQSLNNDSIRNICNKYLKKLKEFQSHE